MLIITVVDGRGVAWFDGKPGVSFCSQFLPVFLSAADAKDPLIQPRVDSSAILADLIPVQVEHVIAVVITLGVGGVGAMRDVAHCFNGSVREGACDLDRTNDLFINDLLSCDDHIA